MSSSARLKPASECTADTSSLAAINDAVRLLPDLYSDLTDLYGDVPDAAPKALIVVTGYPYLFESDPNNSIITALNAATAALNKTIEAAVNATHDTGVNIVYVDVTKQFEDHGIGGRMSLSSTAPPPVYPV
jgi:hypothetical protein